MRVSRSDQLEFASRHNGLSAIYGLPTPVALRSWNSQHRDDDTAWGLEGKREKDVQMTRDDVEVIEQETLYKGFFRLDRIRLCH